MKTAYLVIAHKNAEQIKRLILRLEDGEGDIFIHVDSSMDEKEYSGLYEQCHTDRCHFVEQRMHGVLDDRSLVDITMLCIGAALTHARERNIHYDYYALLSGQDYPLKPMQWIESQLMQTYPMPYIESYFRNETGGKMAELKYNRSRMLIRYRSWVCNDIPKVLRVPFQGVGVFLRTVLRLFGGTTMQRLSKQGVIVRMGSQWWILPDKIIEPIQDAYEKKTPLSETLLTESCTPDETYFQTMCRDDALEPYFSFGGTKAEIRNNRTYTDFGGKSGRKLKGHPYVLTEADFERLKASGCWFARKFDDAVNTEIIRKIEAELL